MTVNSATQQNHESLEIGSEHLQQIIQSAMDAIVSVDERQRIVLFNAAAERMFRCRAADVLGEPLDRFIPPRVRDAHRQHIEEFGRHGVSSRRMGALGELLALRADGKEFPIEASISQVDVGGRKLFTVILRDLTERRRAEAERRSLALFPEQNPYPVLRIARDCTLLYANAAAAPLLARWGVRVGECVPEPECGALLDTLRSGELKEFTVPCGARLYSLVSAPIPAAGYVNLYGRDLTERVQLETNLRQALADKDMLLREVHHRTKNSLQMLGDLLFLQSQVLTGSKEKQALEDSLNRIFAIARLHEQLYQSLESGCIRLGDYLDKLIESFRTVYREAEIRLVTPPEPILLDVDRTIHAGLIMNELLTNALKHAFDGRPGVVTIRVRRVGELLELQVSDDGKGLPPHFDLAETRSLGLRIVHVLARRLQATVDVENAKGTSFTLRFPLASTE